MSTPPKPRLSGAADGMSLAAAPTFAVMALVTAVGGGPLSALCSAVPEASPLSGMVPMYLLMTVFHAGPWLRLLSRPSCSPGPRSGQGQTLAVDAR
jgi:hypothetical protein